MAQVAMRRLYRTTAKNQLHPVMRWADRQTIAAATNVLDMPEHLRGFLLAAANLAAPMLAQQPAADL